MFRKILLAALAMAVAAPANAAWRQASTDHFVIYSEASAKDLEAYATRLERFDRAMRLVRGIPDEKPSPGNRLTVFVVPNLAAVRKLYGGKESDIAGFYSGRATGSVAFTPRSAGGGTEYDLSADIVLFHEYAHHFMMQNYPGAFPAWLIEGFAEFNSTARFEKDGSVGIGAAANHRAYSLAGHNPLKLEKMLAASAFDLKPDERDALYSRGWLLTHFLTFDPSRKSQLTAYLASLNKGVPSLDAAKAAFGDLNKLERELENYLHKSTLPYLTIRADRIKTGPVAIRELGPGEAAVMQVRMRSKRGVDDKSAKELLPLARAAAAPYPNDVLAQTTLAEAEYDAGNSAEAEAAADRALAVDPKSTEALIYKGRARIAAAEASSASDSATWKDARKWIVAANKLEPDDPEPLLLYYSSFLSEGKKPTATAALGLQRALELAPQDRGLRMMLARQLLIDGKAADARAALAPIAFDPHSGGMGEAVTAIIRTLDESGAKAALDLFEKGPPEKAG